MHVCQEWKVRESAVQDEAGDMGREHDTDGFVALVKDFIVIPTSRRGISKI